MASAFLDHPGPIPFAHRGGALEELENTMAAFEAAVRLGYRYLETDARVTSDGVVMAFHDDDLTRLCGRPGRLGELPYSEVKQLRVGGKEPIPRMEDVLGAFPQAKVNLDAKTDGTVAPLADVIRRTGSAQRVCLAAFDGDRLKKIRAAFGPELCTAMGPMEVARWAVAGLVGGFGMPKVPVVQVPLKYTGVPLVTARAVRASDARGVQVHVWTIDEPEEMERVLDLGAHGLLTDRPTVLKAVLERRGQWFG